MTEIRDRSVSHYINDHASYSTKVPEAVFAFTLEEIGALEAWVPEEDGFHQEVVDARYELERVVAVRKMVTEVEEV